MPQLVTRIDDELAARVDELVAAGVIESRSDAVRRGLRAIVEEHRRRQTAEAIIRGYRDIPQAEGEGGWSDAATVRMIADEPW